jgi:hypothetical protein
VKNILVITAISIMSVQSAAVAQNRLNVRLPSAKAKTRTRAEMTPSKPAPTKTIITDSAGNTSTATTTFSPTVHASYTGIMSGPILESEANSKNNISVSNRIAAKADLTENLDAGIQARLNTSFTENGVVTNNENWRVFANIKKIYADDLIDFNLMPRVMLPTSNSAHNQTLIAGPELIATMNINPKNSRFSFDYKAQTQKNFYSDKLASNGSLNFLLLHNFEASYTVGSTTEINLGLYPEYTSTNNAAFTNTSNELDIGFSWSFSKGWALNPYIATELKGLDTSNPGKQMQANLILSGTFL